MKRANTEEKRRANSERRRANYLPAPQYFNLNTACIALVEAFGSHFYLVGSSLQHKEWRDVDIRCILPDDEFNAMFPVAAKAAAHYDAKWSVLSSAIALWLKEHSGLPVDFQFQKRSEANEEYGSKDGHIRHPMGVFLTVPGPAAYAVED